MKKLSPKVISIIVCVLILASSLSCVMGIFAAANNTNNINLLEGKIPITFTGSDVGANHYNWQEIATYNAADWAGGETWKHGYDLRNGQNLLSKENYWLPFTTKLTDGDTGTKQWIEPLVNGKDFVITYEFDQPESIEGFSLKTTGSKHQSKTLKVYVGSDYTELFTNKVDTYTTSDNDVQGTFSTTNTKYIMFVLSDPELYITEIEVYGKKTLPNAAKGLIPITFTGSDVGANHYNWQEIRTEKEGLANSELKFGYDQRNGQNLPSKESYWLPFTTKLTDGNTGTKQWIEPIHNGKDFVITYEFEVPVNVEGFSFKTTGADANHQNKTLKVYVGSDYTELFTNLVNTYTTIDDNIEGTFKKDNTKYVMFVVSDPEWYVTDIEIYGEAATANTIKGLVPITFTGSDVGANHYNWQEIRTEKEGLANSELKFGYDQRNGQNLPSKESYWLPFTTKLTDGNTGTKQWIEPIHNGKDFVITYEFENPVDVEGFSFQTTGADANHQNKTLKVYVGSDYTELFTNLVNTYTTSEDNIEGEFNKSNAKYIMFVASDPEWYVNEIVVYGAASEEDENEDITFTKPNIAKGEMPIVYTSANPGGTGYNWTEVRTSSDANNPQLMFGYSIPIKEGILGLDVWDDHLLKLTDENDNTVMWVQPGNPSHDFVIVYELDANTLLEGFKFDAAGNGGVQGSVYAAESYDELFKSENKKANISSTKYLSCVKGKLDCTAKYVAFVLNKPAFELKEVAIYGTDVAQAAPTFTSENALDGKMPIVFSSANPGGYSYNWTETRRSPDPNNAQFAFGYSVPLNEGVSGIESWKEYLLKLTDGNDYNAHWIEPMRNAVPHDDFVIVYQLDELKTLEGFKFNYIGNDARVKVYASKTHNTLFSNKSLIDEFAVDGYLGSYVKATDAAAEYVALVFDKPGFALSEFAVYAKEYVKPNYGTNLVLNKKPMSIYVANREYPLASNGARLWAYDPDKQSNEMDMITKTMHMFTDDDFTKHIDWLHDGAQKYINTKSHYKVLAWDFGSISTLNKILIDSNMGGYDIYVSEKFNDLYKASSKVYSSGGDQLLPNGELDPSTDLDYGENLIDVAGVKGRYMAIVITRSNRLGVECYDAIPIREIQVYGTEGTPYVGDNLILGKVPRFIYSANYGAYDEQVATFSVREGGPETYTDGKIAGAGSIQFPNSGGNLVYQNGALVMIYYLEGECDVEAFAVRGGYYYAPGGIDLYVSDKFATLFDKENQVYTSGGETAEDGIYDTSKNLGSRELCITLDQPKRGRYAAFVITRIYDIGTYGASGILRIAELEVFGKKNSTEQLPSTTISDKQSGTTATFNYQNPDDTFIFADKGIASFKLTKIDASQYSNIIFETAMLQNRFKSSGDAFIIEFLDKDGNVIDDSALAGEDITFTFNRATDDLVRLGEIRNDSIYVIREAQQYDNQIVFRTDDFSKYKYLFLEPLSGDDLKFNGIVIEVTDEEEQLPEEDQNDATEGDSNADDKPSNNKHWVVVDVDDPLEWFWNIYDTFAANIWMLIACIAMLIICIGLIVAQIIIYRKRRNK